MSDQHGEPVLWILTAIGYRTRYHDSQVEAESDYVGLDAACPDTWTMTPLCTQEALEQVTAQRDACRKHAEKTFKGMCESLDKTEKALSNIERKCTTALLVGPESVIVDKMLEEIVALARAAQGLKS